MKHEASASFPAIAIRPILAASDPHLHAIATPVKTIDDGLRTLIADMFEHLDDAA
ncbi:MAG TPA: peptide deformylase [Thermomicrobiales bacterium]|nr:peptide deformylase [Thermomicrobiales bacterium]